MGIGRSIHAGAQVLADGTEDGAARLERVLFNDPGIGVVRHADAVLARLSEAEAELEAIAGVRGGRLRLALPRSSWIAMSVSYGSGLPFEEADSIEASLEQYGAKTVSRVDFETGRVRSNASVDLGGGLTIAEGGRRALRLSADVRNVTNRFDVINFAGLFSGTALAPPRSAGVRLSVAF